MDGIDSDFVFTLPVWFIIDTNVRERAGWPVEIVAQFAPNYGLYAMMFTDEHLAARHLVESGVPKWAAQRFDDGDEFRRLVPQLAHAGVSHVGIDCPPAHNPRNEGWLFVPLTHLVDRFGSV